MNTHDEKTGGRDWGRMLAAARRWQARIEIGEQGWGEEVYYQATYVYGETIDKLRVAARKYLRERNLVTLAMEVIKL